MKYRIVKESSFGIGNEYYPQYKKFLFWHNFIIDKSLYICVVCFKTYAEARQYIQDDQDKRVWEKERKKSFKREVLNIERI